MTFRLSKKSLKELEGVHPKLVAVVKRAIEFTTVDFAVHDGARTKAEQAEYVKRGVSKTMNSRHLVQEDGLGHAVDLVPYINGKLRWEWEPIYAICVAVNKAAKEMKVELVWGGVWDKRMSQYDCDSVGDAKKAVQAYMARHPGSDFIDGPHYQLVE